MKISADPAFYHHMYGKEASSHVFTAKKILLTMG